ATGLPASPRRLGGAGGGDLRVCDGGAVPGRRGRDAGGGPAAAVVAAVNEDRGGTSDDCVASWSATGRADGAEPQGLAACVEASDGCRGRLCWSGGAEPAAGSRRCPGQAPLNGPRALLARSGRPGRAAFQDLQVPDDGGRRRGAPGRAAFAQCVPRPTALQGSG